jgi:hypothetical protein
MTPVISSTLTVADATKFFDFAEANSFALVKVHKGAKNPVGEGWQKLSSRNRAVGSNGRRKDSTSVCMPVSPVSSSSTWIKSTAVSTLCVRDLMRGASPATWLPLPHHVTTPSGGQHVFIKIPEGVNAMALVSDLRGTIGKGVNVLTGDRQSVAPGSFFAGAEGKPAGLYTFQDAPLYPAPQYIVDFCTRAPIDPAPVSKTGTHDRGDVAGLVDFLAERDDFEEYQDWVNLGMALKLEFGDDGKELWARSHDQTVTPDVIATKWKSFDITAKPGAVTLATFMKRAHQLGWTGTVRPSASSMFAGVARLISSPSIAPVMPLPEGVPSPQAENEFPARAGGYLKHLADLMKTFQMPDYLWDGILQKRFCYSPTGPTGTGKTTIGMLLAAHAAIGRALCGLDVERGSVLYFAAENPTDVLMRWFGLTKAMGLDPATLDVHIIEGVVPLSRAADHIRAECVLKNLKPALVIIDTSAAFFEGDDDNGNVEMGEHARRLRELCTLPGEPCVLILAHPTKGAKTIEEMVPRGGGAFLNEVDGNIGLARVDGLIAAQAVGKFRGPDFLPLHFRLRKIDEPPGAYRPKR